MSNSSGDTDTTCSTLNKEARKERQEEGRKQRREFGEKGEMWRRSGRRMRGEGATKFQQNPQNPRLSDFLPTFPRRERE